MYDQLIPKVAICMEYNENLNYSDLRGLFLSSIFNVNQGFQNWDWTESIRSSHLNKIYKIGRHQDVHLIIN